MNHYYTTALRRNVANNNNNNSNNKAIIRRTMIIRSTSSTTTSTSTRSRINTMNSNNRNMNRSNTSNMSNMSNMNIALIGPPGSGKGSYGKYFAKALQIPIFTVSDLLKKFRPDINISSGKLIDDTIVSETILQGLEDYFDNNNNNDNNNDNNNHNDNNDNSLGGYIIDGFPRTIEQIKLTEGESDETASITTGCWPEKYRIQSAIHLNVPDCVCKTKILGRRQCSKCGTSYNIANVNWNGWIMPSNIPSSQEEDVGHICCAGNSDDNKNNNNESKSCDWSIRRDDDTSDIIEHRLEVYHHNSDPILEYFKNKRTRTTQNRGDSNSDSLLTLTPYHGFDDLPILVDKIHKWIGS